MVACLFVNNIKEDKEIATPEVAAGCRK